MTAPLTTDLLTGRKSQQLFRALREQLEAGHFTVGEQFHTISEICDNFAISSTTAVKCLDRLVQDGLLIRKQGAGTFVSKVPLGESSGRFATISQEIPHCLDYVMPEDISSRAGPEYLGELLAAVQRSRDDDELSLRVNLLPGRIRSAEEIEQWLSRRVRGGAQAFVFRWMPRVAQEVAAAKGWPTCIHGHPDAGIDLPFVDLDQQQMGQRIAEYLIQRDCRRVGVLMRAEWRAGDNLMVNSLLERLGSRLLAIETSPPDDPDVDAAVQRLLGRKPGIDALVMRNHPGQWLPRHIHELRAGREPMPVISEWVWHPLVTPVLPNAATIIRAITGVVTQLMSGSRPDPYSVELEASVMTDSLPEESKPRRKQ